jgi:hypothetical protein
MSDRKGRRDFNSKIWSLIIFEEWLKQNQLSQSKIKKNVVNPSNT